MGVVLSLTLPSILPGRVAPWVAGLVMGQSEVEAGRAMILSGDPARYEHMVWAEWVFANNVEALERCVADMHPYPLPRWNDDEELGRLLSSFETTLPLREPSHLGAPEMRSLILRRSEGTIGEIANLLTEAASVALLSGRERIDAAAVMEAAYQPPTMRRRSMERSVMS